MNQQFLTKEGLKKIKEELAELKNVKRPQLIERIKNAKELGDLSENADYQSAKEEQAFMEGKILELENLIKNAIVVEKHKNGGIVEIGSQVKIETNGKTFEYTITGSNEADPLAGKISNESPLGMEMLGKKKGDEFVLKTPNGEIKYKILEVK